MSLSVSTPVNVVTLATAIFNADVSSVEEIVKTINAFLKLETSTKKKSSDKVKESEYDLAIIKYDGDATRASASIVGKEIESGQHDDFIARLKKTPSLKNAKITERHASKKTPKHVDFKKEFVEQIIKAFADEQIEIEVMADLPEKVLSGYAQFQKDAQTNYPNDFDWTNEEKLGQEDHFRARTQFVSSMWKNDELARTKYGKKDESEKKTKSTKKSSKKEDPVVAKSTTATKKSKSKSSASSDKESTKPAKTSVKLTTTELAKTIEPVENSVGNWEMDLHGRKFVVTVVPKYLPGHKNDPYVIVGKQVEDDVIEEEELESYDAVIPLTADDKAYIAAHTTKYKYVDSELLKTLTKKADQFPYEDFENVKKLVEESV